MRYKAVLSQNTHLHAGQHEQDDLQPQGAFGFPCPTLARKYHAKLCEACPEHRAHHSPEGFQAPPRYLGVDKDLPKQRLDVVVGSSHNNRNLVSSKDIFNVLQSRSISRNPPQGERATRRSPPLPAPHSPYVCRAVLWLSLVTYSPLLPVPASAEIQRQSGRAAPGSALLLCSRGPTPPVLKRSCPHY